MSLDIRWFCVLLAEQGIVPAETCTELLQDLGPDADLLTLAQAVLDQGLCNDLEAIQALANDACQHAENEDPIPIEDSPDDDEEEPVTLPLSEPEAPPPASPSPPSPPAATGTATLSDLENAAAMSDDDAAALMKHILQESRKMGASDLHLSAGSAPFVRYRQTLTFLANTPLSAEASQRLNTVLLNEEHGKIFEKERDICFGMELDDGDRYRVNLSVHKNGPSGTYHIVPNRIRSLARLGFPNHKDISKLLDYHNGLILVTGPTGSGKTSTLAALVDELNSRRKDHIITVEEPIEFVFESRRCNITQREVGQHTESYASALKGALREDPDIIIIGELHDLETIEMAITAAETGHLVIGTLHTSDSASTLNRLLDVFPPAQQQQIRAMTSESLRGIICQRLVPCVDDGKLAVANELLLSSPAVTKIIREGRTHLLVGVMQTGGSMGMRSMDQSFFELFEEGRIDMELALNNIRSRDMCNRIRARQRLVDEAEDAEQQDDAPAKKKRGWFR